MKHYVLKCPVYAHERWTSMDTRTTSQRKTENFLRRTATWRLRYTTAVAKYIESTGNLISPVSRRHVNVTQSRDEFYTKQCKSNQKTAKSTPFPPISRAAGVWHQCSSGITNITLRAATALNLYDGQRYIKQKGKRGEKSQRDCAYTNGHVFILEGCPERASPWVSRWCWAWRLLRASPLRRIRFRGFSF